MLLSYLMHIPPVHQGHLISPGTRLRLLPTAPDAPDRPAGGGMPPSRLPRPSRLPGARPTFSLLPMLLSLRTTMGISPRDPMAELLPLPLTPAADREPLPPARDVRGSRLLPAAPNSPLIRRGIPVGPSLLRGRYSIPSRSTAAERRGLAATSM